MIKKKTKKKTKYHGVKWWDVKLWKIFADYIKERDKHVCFTCGKVVYKYECQAGHMFSRVYQIIKYNELNVHVQCTECNIRWSGNHVVYKDRFARKYGIDEYLELEKLVRAHQSYKLNIPEYMDLYEKYKAKLKELQDENN